MHVRRLILHGVKTLWRDIPEGGGALPEAARHRLLLMGGNGSGKTTVLETIRALWEVFGQWIEEGDSQEFRIDRHGLYEQPALRALVDAHGVAMELGDFPEPGRNLWIGLAQNNTWEKFKHEHSGDQFVGLSWPKGAWQGRIELPPGDWQDFRHRSMVGKVPQPNIVSFPPDDRRVTVPPKSRARLIDTTAQGWSAAYSPDIDLESILLTVQAEREPAEFVKLLDLVNLALRHRDKRITGWVGGRLRVEGKTLDEREFTHTVDGLSSGERQFLLMVAYVAGFLRPGGIVLIDEPDLHIHLSMVTQLMQTLDSIVRERGGQLIVASHSERVWDSFSRDSEKIELTPWRGGEP